MDATNILGLINYAVVLFFGITTSLYLADIPFFRNKKIYLLTYLGFFILQVIFYLFWGADTLTLYRCYPFLIHLPLTLLICASDFLSR